MLTVVLYECLSMDRERLSKIFSRHIANVCNAMQHLWDVMGVPFVLFWCVVVALNMAHHRFVIPKEALKFDIK